jgi:hypothetical protein
VGVVRRSRFSGAAMRLVLLILITVGLVVTVTAAFLMLWSGAPSDVRVTEQADRNSSPDSALFGEGSTQDSVGAKSEARRPETQAVAGDSFRFATKLHENHAADYSFRYPDGWELKRHRTISKLKSPGRRFAVSFGLGPRGRVSDAYDEFVALVAETYTDVAVEIVDATHVGDNVAVLARGAATTSAGMRVRFLVTLIERPRNQRAIGALAATNVETARFPRAVKEVLASFRPI